jgi:hypothetical protein
MKMLRSLLLILVVCGTVHSQRAAPRVPADNQERAKSFSDLPLDSDHFKFAFRIADDGGAMVVTALSPTDPTDPGAEEHLQRRLGRLAVLAVHCNFTAPEFRGAGSSQQARTLCESRPKIQTITGHDSPPGHTPQYGTIVLEFSTGNAHCIHLLQDLVRAIAAQYPGSEFDDASQSKHPG